jgi:DHA2 family methylenomycin A resistance protein-like MFS transporter
MPVMVGLVLDSVPSARAGTASAVFNTFRQVGGAVAVTGMQTGLAIAAALLFVTAIISL